MFLRWLLVWLAVAAPLRALEVRQTIWGFDGHVVPGRFNPVSVLVDNPRPAAFDGQLVLGLVDGAGGPRGTEYVQPVFLAPNTTRWVQFQVFVGNNVGHYAVQWGRSAKDRSELPGDLSLGAPGCVWLRDTENPFGSAGMLKSFPDELFPTTVIATDGLAAVVLDHVPRWEPARREAFLDWLKRGGTVHVVPGADGKFPVFAEGLEVLNAEGEMARIGTGLVRRHEVGPREMSEKYLLEHGYPPRTLKQTQNPVVYDLEGLFSQRLSSLTRPTVNWSTIHLLALAYVAAIGPLHYRFRRRLDYRVSILAFLGVVAVFGTALAFVGRRGYGESQTVNSLTIARVLGGGRYDCTQWISAFATTGDLYTLTHDAPANFYDTGAIFDAAGCRTLNGKDGRVQMDIPLYSSRTFIHRGVMTGDEVSVTLEKPTGETKGGRGWRLRTGPGFPKEFAEAQLLVDDVFHELVLRNGVLEVSSKPAVPMGTYFSREKLSPLAYQTGFGRDANPDAPRALLPLLMARALGVQDVFLQNIVEPPAPAGRMQLCVVARAPDSFRLRGPGFDRERGWVLYVQDLLQP